MVGLRGICFALVAGLALSACSNDSGMMNLRSATPDEFGVMPNKPLEMPDSFAQLPMPVPGAGNRADINPVAEGRAALGGRSPNAGGIPAADTALLATSQRYGITPDIRVVLAVEDAEWRAGNRGRLDNGMQVVVIEDHRSPAVVHMVWYRAGAADEPPGQSGVAHFLEHLMFKGTDDVESGAFSRIVEANGGTDNAFTSWDYTGYFQRVAADRLGLMMELEADRMRDLRFADEEVVTERS
jgi:hypothetical protein